MADEECLFCSIAAGEQEADVVYESEDVVGFHDVNPQAPSHLLFIPREHIPTVNNMREEHEELVGKLFSAAREVAREEGFDEEGYRLVMNCGEDALQSVFHMHLHCLAGREMDWPPG